MGSGAGNNLTSSPSTSLPSKLLSSKCSSNSVSSLNSASSRIVSGIARSVFWKACSAAAFFAISVFLYLGIRITSYIYGLQLANKQGFSKFGFQDDDEREEEKTGSTTRASNGSVGTSCSTTFQGRRRMPATP